MADFTQNTLYLTTPANYIARDHLTLHVEVPLYPENLPPAERARERASDWKKLSIPIHMLPRSLRAQTQERIETAIRVIRTTIARIHSFPR